jgi:hypothetical protein
MNSVRSRHAPCCVRSPRKPLAHVREDAIRPAAFQRVVRSPKRPLAYARGSVRLGALQRRDRKRAVGALAFAKRHPYQLLGEEFLRSKSSLPTG